jgi:hypothetical protein
MQEGILQAGSVIIIFLSLKQSDGNGHCPGPALSVAACGPDSAR